MRFHIFGVQYYMICDCAYWIYGILRNDITEVECELCEAHYTLIREDLQVFAYDKNNNRILAGYKH